MGRSTRESDTLERLRVPELAFFDKRASKGLPHWPTLRGARLDDEAFKRLRRLADLVYLEGTYNTNLNKYVAEPSLERAFFAETRKSMQTLQGKPYILYILWWIGNYHAGSIVHIAFQYPHCLGFSKESMLLAACTHYRRVVAAAYGDRELHDDVAEFVEKYCRGKATQYINVADKED